MTDIDTQIAEQQARVESLRAVVKERDGDLSRASQERHDIVNGVMEGDAGCAYDYEETCEERHRVAKDELEDAEETLRELHAERLATA